MYLLVYNNFIDIELKSNQILSQGSKHIWTKPRDCNRQHLCSGFRESIARRELLTARHDRWNNMACHCYIGKKVVYTHCIVTLAADASASW